MSRWRRKDPRDWVFSSRPRRNWRYSSKGDNGPWWLVVPLFALVAIALCLMLLQTLGALGFLVFVMGLAAFLWHTFRIEPARTTPKSPNLTPEPLDSSANAPVPSDKDDRGLRAWE
jgi:Flp pilus assembly protein TadB